MSKVKKLIFIALVSSILLVTNAFADKRWYVSATLNGMAGKYSESDYRNDLFSGSAWLNVDYIDVYSVAVAYNNLNVNYTDVGMGSYDINQESVAARFQYNFYNDALGGKITTQLVAHSVTNDSPLMLSDDVVIVAPKIIYTNYSKTFVIDFEYVYSDYSNNNEFIMEQFSPAIGFGFNKNSDWVQIKAFLIQSSERKFSQDEESLTSIKINWQHEFYSPTLFGINDFFIDVLSGERVFAVDNETFSVLNLEGVQQGSVLFGLGWRVGEDFDVAAVVGTEKYKNKLIDDTYNREHLYISLTKHW